MTDPRADAAGHAEPEHVTTDVVVVGGGIAGLVAALECAKLGLAVTVLEQADRPGGCVGRIELDGLALDSGAESFATRGGSVATLLESLGLSSAVVSPNPVGAWLVWGGGRSGGRASGAALRAAQLPKAGVLGIPANPLGDDVRAIIGWRGAWRAYSDRLMPILKIGRVHRLGPLVRQRMGSAVLDRLVAPISAGVYSSDPDDLDLDVVAPGLNEAMTRAGSLSGGVAQLVGSRKAGTAVHGIDGGMHRLVDALLAELDRFGAVVRTGMRATAVERRPGAGATAGPDAATAGWRVTAVPVVADPEPAGDSILDALATIAAADAAGAASAAEGADAPRDLVLDAPYAVLATPAHVSMGLLDGVLPGQVDAADWPAAASVELVTLVLDAPALDAAPRGTGVLVAADTPGVTAKALTHSSAKWSWLADAAAGRHVVRLSYGRAGATNPLDGLDDDRVAALAVADAARLLGVPLERSDVRAVGRSAWRDALSQAAVGQRERVAALEERLVAEPGLEVAGSWVAGTGLASVVPQAIDAASRIRHLSVEARGDA